MKVLYTIILSLFCLLIQAQDYYYNGNEKIKIYKSGKAFIAFEPLTSTITNDFENVETYAAKGFTILENTKNNLPAEALKKQNSKQMSPALLLDANGVFNMFPTKKIRIKLKPNRNKAEVIRQLQKTDFLKVEEKYGIVRITIKDIRKVVEIANKIYESGIAEFAMPDFYIPIEANQINDPLFPSQFQMHNTGQSIDGVPGLNTADCNILEAWDIALGDNITVAVFDNGMENHEDFGDRLIGGYTPANAGNGAPSANEDNHGMNCAGVIGASHNNLGVRGVAPHVNFLSVNIFAPGTTNGEIADGIQWALNQGADVFSNSWSFGNVPCDFTNADVENAIQNAVTNGRDGKGAVFVFAAGNTGGCVRYPARNDNVMAVGAIDHRGNLFDYSARGSQLDLVAPSGEAGGFGNVRTVDKMGIRGNRLGNYESSFGGTSAACPVVSGIAALILSLNPNLTQQEVRDILTSTATDMGASGFDNNFGFGLVNARRALEKIILENVQLTTNNTICNSNTRFSLSPIPSSIPVNWSVSSNLQIIDSSITGITIKAINGLAQGNGFVSVAVSTKVITKNVWVGLPGAINELSHLPELDCRLGEINVRSNGGEDQYEWIISGGTIQRSDSSTDTGGAAILVNPTDGSYGITVKVRASNACGSSDWYTKYIPTRCLSGDDQEVTSLDSALVLDDKALFFPNPAAETIFLNLNELTDNEQEPIFFIQLWDLNGKIVLETETDRLFATLGVSGLQNGVYILKLTNGDQMMTAKLAIQH